MERLLFDVIYRVPRKRFLLLGLVLSFHCKNFIQGQRGGLVAI